MRTLYLNLIATVALAAVAGCTVKDVDTPALAGPSTFAYSIELQSNTNTLVQDGVSQARITITARDPMGQPMNGRPLRAEILVDGIPQDFGSLNTKSPVTGGTLIYTAPPASPLTTASQTVSIGVTPIDSGVVYGEFARSLDLTLVPQGVILPSNPSLVAAFTITPTNPQVMTTVSFDASTSTNGGAPCADLCLYSWNFGDGTSGTGRTVTHQYRTSSTFVVTLTLTDSRSATSKATRTLTVAPGTPPTAGFITSPANPGVNQDIFFNASQSTPAAGRTITSYEWNFGDGSGATGVLVTHRYVAGGSYQVQLSVTDDAGTVGRLTTPMQVGQTLGPTPVAVLTCAPSAPKPGGTVSCNASASRPGTGANITQYVYNWGDGSVEENVTNPLQTHVYPTAGTFTVTVTVTDSLGRTSAAQVTFDVKS